MRRTPFLFWVSLCGRCSRTEGETEDWHTDRQTIVASLGIWRDLDEKLKYPEQVNLNSANQALNAIYLRLKASLNIGMRVHTYVHMYVFRSWYIIICLGYVLCGGSINSWLTSTKFEIQSVTKFVESAKTPLDPEQRIMYEFCELRVELPEQQKNQSFSGTFYSSSSSTYIHIIW